MLSRRDIESIKAKLERQEAAEPWDDMWSRPFDRPELVHGGGIGSFPEDDPRPGAFHRQTVRGNNSIAARPITTPYAAILADPPWAFETYSGPAVPTTGEQPYKTLSTDDLCAMPIADCAARDSVLFLWITWPMLMAGLEVIEAWGFKYKTCAFAWMKADGTQLNMFPEHYSVRAGMGYWTMSNSEVCLLATRGKPKRLNCDVRQGIIEPRREHSRKPDEIYRRIERLVGGPYLELFARQTRIGWDSWGNEVTKYNGTQRPTGPAID